MVRLMLVLAPAVCVLAAIAVSHIVTKASKNIRLSMIGGSSSRAHAPEISILVLIFIFYILKTYVFHQMSFAHSQSSPTFIMESGSINDGNRYMIDDFREAYYWLK